MIDEIENISLGNKKEIGDTYKYDGRIRKSIRGLWTLLYLNKKAPKKFLFIAERRKKMVQKSFK